ncbi:MAG TPA: hypothetical protein VES38_11730 [Methylotenera sp.]|nr:hypothetical protein [Methylotenera sp.]
MSKTVSDDGVNEKLRGSDGVMEFQRQKTLLKTSTLQDAIFNSASFSNIATYEKYDTYELTYIGKYASLMNYPGENII